MEMKCHLLEVFCPAFGLSDPSHDPRTGTSEDDSDSGQSRGTSRERLSVPQLKAKNQQDVSAKDQFDYLSYRSTLTPTSIVSTENRSDIFNKLILIKSLCGGNLGSCAASRFNLKVPTRAECRYLNRVSYIHPSAPDGRTERPLHFTPSVQRETRSHLFLCALLTTY